MFFFFHGARDPLDSPQLERFAHAIQIIHRRYSAMTVGQLVTLFRVGLAPGEQGQFVSVSDIVDRSRGQKYPTISRQLDILSDGAVGRPGLGLVDKSVDPNDGRSRHVALSEKGKALLYELDLVLEPQVAAVGIDRKQESKK